ncbi:SDH family Clp fold serine proteinase [Candidatus Palauibacter sp.]|uniref:SDH family Clp fold serine proteinase n=1 Tax=Candidatus Palauibacter sp. TaxID=3101350 RepID=UPI003B02421B
MRARISLSLAHLDANPGERFRNRTAPGGLGLSGFGAAQENGGYDARRNWVGLGATARRWRAPAVVRPGLVREDRTSQAGSRDRSEATEEYTEPAVWSSLRIPSFRPIAFGFSRRCFRTQTLPESCISSVTRWEGDGNSALHLVRQAQSRCTELTVIVPDQAKSAGTLFVLGAHHIVMGPTSDLGPVDPQFRDPQNPHRPISGKALIRKAEN